MFCKNLFWRALVLFSVFGVVYAQTSDVVDLFPHEKEIRAVPCEDCPPPGQECESYISTPTDKKCISPRVTVNETPEEEERRLHEEGNARDTHNLQGDLEHPEDAVITPIHESDVDTTPAPEPVEK